MWVTGQSMLNAFRADYYFLTHGAELYSVSRNESPPTQHIRTPLCSFHWVKQEISSFTQTLCLRWSYRESSGTSYFNSTEKSPKKSSQQLHEQEGKHNDCQHKTGTHFTSDPKVQQKAN